MRSFFLRDRARAHSMSRVSRRATSRRRPVVESLEGRALLALSSSVSAGTLSILGSDLADSSILTLDNRGTTTNTDDRLVVQISNAGENHHASHDIYRAVRIYNELLRTWSTTYLQLIRDVQFRGLGGGDYFANTTDRPVKAYGGAGNDTLNGGGGGDELYGEADIDSLVGGGGDDTLSGGLFGDALDGGAGTDWVFDSGPSFTLSNTRLSSSLPSLRGTDTLVSIERARLLGGGGNDYLNAAAFSGSVVLEGGGGNDTLLGSGKPLPLSLSPLVGGAWSPIRRPTRRRPATDNARDSGRGRHRVLAPPDRGRRGRIRLCDPCIRLARSGTQSAAFRPMTRDRPSWAPYQRPSGGPVPGANFTLTSSIPTRETQRCADTRCLPRRLTQGRESPRKPTARSDAGEGARGGPRRWRSWKTAPARASSTTSTSSHG